MFFNNEVKFDYKKELISPWKKLSNESPVEDTLVLIIINDKLIVTWLYKDHDNNLYWYNDYGLKYNFNEVSYWMNIPNPPN